MKKLILSFIVATALTACVNSSTQNEAPKQTSDTAKADTTNMVP